MKTATEHAAKAIANTFLRKVERGESIDSQMALNISQAIGSLLGLLELSRISPGDDIPSYARFSFVRVTTPGCEGTINLMWDEYPVAWINSVQIAREIMAEIPEHNAEN